MKRFLKNISIFILLMGVINVYFFLIVYDNYFVQYEQVENDYHTYLLSDSHGEPLGKKDEKYKFYNFSSASESYVDMKRKTHYLIENTDVKRIIITADNHMLSPYRDKSNNLDRSSYFAPMSEYDSPLQYFKESYIKRYIPLLNSKSRDIIKIHFTAEKEAFEKEKDWWDLTASEREKKVKDRIEYQFSKPHGSIKQARALLEIIDLCKTNNIELIGIKYPLSREYYN